MQCIIYRSSRSIAFLHPLGLIPFLEYSIIELIASPFLSYGLDAALDSSAGLVYSPSDQQFIFLETRVQMERSNPSNRAVLILAETCGLLQHIHLDTKEALAVCGRWT
jgi:hypothetical protein